MADRLMGTKRTHPGRVTGRDSGSSRLQSRPVQVGPYSIIRRIGAGGMGIVYLARHRHLARNAAIKVILPEYSADRRMVRRLFTEARAIAKLRHPSIVEIFDCDILPDGRAYIVMEYLEGESLGSCLSRVGSLYPDMGTALAITGLVADALHVAHENGIVHRDLKPDNVYLTYNRVCADRPAIKLLDFGVAKLLRDPSQHGLRTGTGIIVGTPRYMSPEQCRGMASVDHRSDIYSLGCMLFEMVTGRAPFLDELPGDLLLAHVSQTPPRLTALRPDVPTCIEAFVASMLEKDPARRPQSMGEVIAVIQSQLELEITEAETAIKWPAGFPVRQTEEAMIPDSEPLEDARIDRGAVRPPQQDRANRGTLVGRSGRRINRRVAVATMALGTAVFVGAGAWLSNSVSHTVTADHRELKKRIESTARPTADAEPPPPETTAEATLVDVRSEPAGAEIWLPGESIPRGVTPSRIQLARSNTRTGILLKAPGFVDTTVWVDGSHDARIDAVLTPSRENDRRHAPRKGSQKATRPENPNPYRLLED